MASDLNSNINIGDASLEEPLLDGASNSNLAAKKSRGCDTVTPYATAGVLRIPYLSWLTPLLASAKEKSLDLDDIPQLNTSNTAFEAFTIFKHRLDEFVASRSSRVITKFGLIRALFLLAWKETLWTAILALMYTSTRYVGPLLIESFVQCLNGQGKFKHQGYTLALIFSIAALSHAMIKKHCIFKTQQLGFRARAVLTTMIYNKGLTLSSQSKASGELINAVAVDAEAINSFIVYMHDTWLIILEVGVALLILYNNLQFASFAALAVAVCIMLSNTLFAKLENRFRGNLMKSKDNRMKVTMETLRNMRILKFQGWEMNFLNKILQLRRVETVWLKKYLYNSAKMSFVLGISPTCVALATFGSCILMGIPLDAGKIFSALATFRVLQTPIYNLPDTISMLVATNVSLGRIASFLSLEEVQQDDDAVEKLPRGSSDYAVEITDGNFCWDISSPPDYHATTLKDINLKVAHGKRVAVCGTVGSGKSSLLSCILGEITKISGTVKLCGTKAYVAQSPWIHSGTIQENILFGKKIELQRYNKVLKACCLNKDLGILPFGDQTVVGERGINLSGGQKQRIQIARAIYHDADIYLFDDPFSAVDAHTGSHLFQEVLLGCLSGKTIVYVTHQVEFLSSADLVVVMKDGKITQSGKYCDILEPGSDFMELVGAQNVALSSLDHSMPASASNDESIKQVSGGENEDTRGEGGKEGQQLIQEEERKQGSVGFPIYWKYLTTAYGGFPVLLILFTRVLLEILRIGSNFWLASATPLSSKDDMRPPVSGSTLITVYTSLAIGISSCTLAVNMLVATVGYKIANILFTKMHQCIFRAPMSFFDATPSGRILNRCSTDQSAVETRVPNLVEDLASTIIQILGVIAVMATVAWQVLIIFIPVAFASIWYQRYYMPFARDLSRLARVSEAPVIQHFSETISGTSTIRSFDQQSRFKATYMKVVDAYSRPDFHLVAGIKWLTLRVDSMCCFTFAFFLALLVFFADRIDPAIAGMAVIYGFNLNIELAGLVWILCHCETKMISVERILQYTSVPSEAPLVIEANRLHHSWPSHGEIVVDKLQVRYAPHMPLVLHGITCTFQGGMKTGIVGRTGSGKSTLIQALFRVLEAAAGRILIDGIDISLLGLQDLRSRLSIIPQDPTMFQGTVRSNLDPLEQYSDEQIWETLDKCQLGDEVKKMDRKLDSYVNENGENWSMGQRQLICLGRVLLKKTKVLVLDEATASVDTATDNIIQQTLKQHFSHCTVITIAHRITSVIDSDMVLVLSQGLIEEYDSPTSLLQNKSSAFAQLVDEYMSRSNSRL